VLPALSVASLVGFGAVVAALPAFDAVRDWVLAIEGGPLVSLAVSTNILASLTGSASGGLSIALGALGENFMRLAADYGIEPSGLRNRCGNARRAAAQWRRRQPAGPVRRDAQDKLSGSRHRRRRRGPVRADR